MTSDGGRSGGVDLFDDDSGSDIDCGTVDLADVPPPGPDLATWVMIASIYACALAIAACTVFGAYCIFRAACGFFTP